LSDQKGSSAGSGYQPGFAGTARLQWPHAAGQRLAIACWLVAGGVGGNSNKCIFHG
jgi:hypothetical protein